MQYTLLDEYIAKIYGQGFEGMTPFLVGELFCEMSKNGVASVSVNKEQEELILRYFIANTNDCREELVTGKVKKLMGVEIFKQCK